MKPVLCQSESTILANSSKLATVEFNNQKYQLHPLIAYYLKKKQAGEVSIICPEKLKTLLTISDCMVSQTGSTISIFTLCETPKETADMLINLMQIRTYIMSKTTQDCIDLPSLLKVLDDEFTTRDMNDNFHIFNLLFESIPAELFKDMTCLNNKKNIRSLFLCRDVPNAPLSDYLMNLPEFLPFIIVEASIGRNIQPKLQSQLDKDQYLLLVELLESDQFKAGREQLKLTLLYSYGFIFTPKCLDDFISRVCKLNAELLDAMFLKIESLKIERPSNAYLVSQEGVKLLLEKNQRVSNQYYLSGLKDAKHAKRIKWLHVFGFTIDLSWLEHLLKEEPFRAGEILNVKRVLPAVEEELKAFTPHFVIAPIDALLKEALINLLDKDRARTAPYLIEELRAEVKELKTETIELKAAVANMTQLLQHYLVLNQQINQEPKSEHQPGFFAKN